MVLVLGKHSPNISFRLRSIGQNRLVMGTFPSLEQISLMATWGILVRTVVWAVLWVRVTVLLKSPGTASTTHRGSMTSGDLSGGRDLTAPK